MALAEWLAEATPDRREVPVCLDRRLVSRLVQVRRRVEEIEAEGKTLGKSEDRKELEELEEQVRAKTRTLVFDGIGWGAWRQLLAKHPPAKDQVETFERAVQLGFMPHAIQNIGFNAETFVPAAIAASAAEPTITPEEAADFLAAAPAGVLDRVWAAVLEVNLAGADDPFVPAVSDGARRTVKRSKPR
jgi:hypothetical protein